MTKRMGRVICDLSISADGYSAGINQTEERPFGDDGGDGWGGKLHAWFADTPEENPAEVEQLKAPSAFIIGRNMFGPCAASGIGSGTAGGARIRRSAPRSSCSPITRATRSRWTAAPRTTSSPTESSRHWHSTGGGRRRRCRDPGRRDHYQPVPRRLIDELRLHIVALTLGASTRLFEGVPPLKLEQVKSRAAPLVTQ